MNCAHKGRYNGAYMSTIAYTLPGAASLARIPTLTKEAKRRLESLEERSKRPRHTRNWEVSRMQEFRVLALRKQHIRYGKEKLKILYQEQHGEPISSWKIQRVIEKHGLYYHP